MSREEFEKQKAESAKRIWEMYRGHVMPPYPEFLKPEPIKEPDEPQKKPAPVHKAPPKHDREAGGIGNVFSRLDLAQITNSPDGLLILGLILLLLADKADEKLILSLVFLIL